MLNKKIWLMTSPARLVELDTGRRVEIRRSSDGTQSVWLCGDDAEVLLFEGPASSSYLAGLAQLLVAATSEELVRLGRGASAA